MNAAKMPLGDSYYTDDVPLYARRDHHLDGEVWRDIPSQPHYQVSCFGRVRSKAYTRTYCGSPVYHPPKLIVETRRRTRSPRSEPAVGLSHQPTPSRCRTVRIAALVLEAWGRPAPEPGRRIVRLYGTTATMLPDALAWAPGGKDA